MSLLILSPVNSKNDDFIGWLNGINGLVMILIDIFELASFDNFKIR